MLRMTFFPARASLMRWRRFGADALHHAAAQVFLDGVVAYRPAQVDHADVHRGHRVGEPQDQVLGQLALQVRHAGRLAVNAPAAGPIQDRPTFWPVAMPLPRANRAW